jgi:hypothetical protein
MGQFRTHAAFNQSPRRRRKPSDFRIGAVIVQERVAHLPIPHPVRVARGELLQVIDAVEEVEN